MQYYDDHHHRVIFASTTADQQYWDQLWRNQNDIAKQLATGGGDDMVRHITKRFLPPNLNTKILDGGCGKGKHVASLSDLGYDAYGIDYAPAIVKQINKLRPDLKVVEGDVRSLPYPAQHFDGYWSLGVIEHFWNGYQEIAQEMQRVIKPDGFLFLVFPHMSKFRKLKAKLGRYQLYDRSNFNLDNFYQFALDDQAVSKHFSKYGFSLKLRQTHNGYKGIKEESGLLQPYLQRLADSPYFAARATKAAISHTLHPLTSHTVLLVLRRQ